MRSRRAAPALISALALVGLLSFPGLVAAQAHGHIQAQQEETPSVYPQPEISLAYNNLFAARVNPLGLVDYARFSLRLRLYERYIELIGRARMLCLEDDRRFSTDWKGDTLLELNEHSRCTFGLLGGFSFSW